MTSKGELVRSIMFPKPVDFKFTQDSYKFVGILGLLASVGMVYTLIIMVNNSLSYYSITIFVCSIYS